MASPEFRPAFTDEQFDRAYKLLARAVAHMNGRKLEEGDWSEVYCEAKEIPYMGWSNLATDVVFDGIGVEHKLLGTYHDPTLLCGHRVMHPAATGSIRVDTSMPEQKAMESVLGQYGAKITADLEAVRKACPDALHHELRTGLMLWQRSLAKFLYFEEALLPPDPRRFYSRWEERQSTGKRKPSKNLWIFDKKTREKVFSITSVAGAKVQPYFKIPAKEDCYTFHIRGHPTQRAGHVATWVSAEVYGLLERVLDGTTPDEIAKAVSEVAEELGTKESLEGTAHALEAQELTLLRETWNTLETQLPTLDDGARLRLVAKLISDRSGR